MSMEAVITDPLKKQPKYKAAVRKTRRIKSNKDQIIDNKGRKVYKSRLKTSKKDKRSIKNKFADKRANKVEFDTRYMWDTVKDVLKGLDNLYDPLHASNSGLNDVLTATNQMAEMAANNQALLQQDAMRMSLLLGAPLPEKAAESVVIGDNRYEIDSKDRGRRSLRIEQLPPSLAI